MHTSVYLDIAVFRVADPDPAPDPYIYWPLDPDPDQVVRCTDPDPDPSVIRQKLKKTLIPTVFLPLYDFLSLKNDIHKASKSIKQKN
jgi:hypothetical protein